VVDQLRFAPDRLQGLLLLFMVCGQAGLKSFLLRSVNVAQLIQMGGFQDFFNGNALEGWWSRLGPLLQPVLAYPWGCRTSLWESRRFSTSSQGGNG
jgi:hypothetical protein